jgi:hypothetical protein
MRNERALVMAVLGLGNACGRVYKLTKIIKLLIEHQHSWPDVGEVTEV